MSGSNQLTAIRIT